MDPLYSKYVHNSTYAFSENSVVAFVELEGLERVSIHTYSFAPFDLFGGVYKGDGSNRKFGDPIQSDIGNENYRIGATININLGLGTSLSEAHGSVSVQHLDMLTGSFEICYSDAIVELSGERIQENTWLANIHNYGSNCTVALSCDIDVFAGITVMYFDKPNPEDGGILFVAGSVKGDRFPANENFVTDDFGNKVMMGVSGVDSDWAYAAPYTELCGNITNEDMSNWNFGIEMDNNGSFTQVWFNSHMYSIDDWNRKFTSLDPKNVSTNTSIDSSSGQFKTKK